MAKSKIITHHEYSDIKVLPGKWIHHTGAWAIYFNGQSVLVRQGDQINTPPDRIYDHPVTYTVTKITKRTVVLHSVHTFTDGEIYTETRTWPISTFLAWGLPWNFNQPQPQE